MIRKVSDYGAHAAAPAPERRGRDQIGDQHWLRVIAFANQKGGVAKTTTTLNLGVALAEQGERVLAIDLDPQGNLTMSQGWNPDEIERSMFDVLVHKLPIAETSAPARSTSPSRRSTWPAPSSRCPR